MAVESRPEEAWAWVGSDAGPVCLNACGDIGDTKEADEIQLGGKS